MMSEVALLAKSNLDFRGQSAAAQCDLLNTERKSWTDGLLDAVAIKYRKEKEKNKKKKNIEKRKVGRPDFWSVQREVFFHF